LALSQTDQLIERIEPVVRASGDAEALRLLEAVLTHQRRARDLEREERWNPALVQTRVARNLALDAEVAAGSRRRP
jgi:hypothetical protein